MLSHEELKKLLYAKAKVFGPDSQKIEPLGHIHLEDGTGIPDFVTVHTGFLGASENFALVNDAEISNGHLYMRFPLDYVEDAPNIDPDGGLDEVDEDSLYHYYSRAGLGSPDAVSDPTPSPVNNDPDVLAASAPFAVRKRLVHDDFAPRASADAQMRGPRLRYTRAR